MVSARKGKVLVVEDNVMNKILVKEILNLHGYEVIEAATGEEAVEMALSGKPDIVLMDVNLPGMDGVAATRAIKDTEGFEGMPVVAITASAMKGDEEKFMGSGFDGYIPKPVDVAVLLDSIERALRQRKPG
ncbi:MAG: response regulator [Thermodesulfobacteriota bacterium]